MFDFDGRINPFATEAPMCLTLFASDNIFDGIVRSIVGVHN